LREIGEAAAPAAVEGRGAGALTIGDSGRISHSSAPSSITLAAVVGGSSPERRVNNSAPSLPPTAPAIGRPNFAFPPPTGSARPVEAATSAPQPPSSSTTRSWRFLGLAHGSYALFETPAGLVLLDRRAAHERIWFERLQAQFRSGSVPSQRLLLPVPVELDPIATALLLDRLAFFNGHGFEIVEFGRNFFRIESVPTWMEPADAEAFVRDLLGALREGRLQDKNIDVANDELARLAVAKAIRLPEVAREAELQGVVTQLFACRTPLTSPSGRPTQIELNHGELARRFQK